MTLLVAVHTKEGIAVASDSRAMVTSRSVASNAKGKLCYVDRNVFVSNSFSKTMLIGGCSVSICGTLDCHCGSVADVIRQDTSSLDRIDAKVLASMVFDILESKAENTTRALVSGYVEGKDEPESRSYLVNMDRREIETRAEAGPCAVYAGVTNIMERLTHPVFRYENVFVRDDLGPVQFEFKSFSLQDAVDFCQYAVRMTEATLRFARDDESVGGPVDIATITPDGARWICRHGVTADPFWTPYTHVPISDVA